MIIAMASGKGGTGKTTVTASLAAVWPNPVLALDLDVEAPNLHLFLNPEIEIQEVIPIEVPRVDPERCTACGDCAELCQFKALSVLGERLLVFGEMCHSCGGCFEVCPEKALIPGRREIGEVLQGRCASGAFLMGRLRVGEAMSPPLIRETMRRARMAQQERVCDILLDGPPGTSCPAVAAVHDADFVVMVTEPTPLGFHDLELAWSAFEKLGKPMGVVINRTGMGESRDHSILKNHPECLLAEIPYDLELAAAYSRGAIASELSDTWRGRFQSLASKILRRSGAGGVS